MANTDFLNDLTESQNKKQYQQFKCELGIDHVLVLIPLKEAKSFEKEALKQQPTTRSQLKSLVSSYNGLFEEVK